VWCVCACVCVVCVWCVCGVCVVGGCGACVVCVVCVGVCVCVVCVCVCSLRYPACKAQGLYYHMWPVLLQHILPQCLIKDNVFGKK